MELDKVISEILEPAYLLLPARMESKAATVMLLAIGLQESRFEHRRQIGGPARGFWQFEQGGGVTGVLKHPASREHAVRVCDECGVAPVAEQVYQRLEHDDILAAAFARLLLWTDSQPLPAVGEMAKGWGLYARTWRPGKPHRETWDVLYGEAMDEVLQ